MVRMIHIFCKMSNPKFKVSLHAKCVFLIATSLHCLSLTAQNDGCSEFDTRHFSHSSALCAHLKSDRCELAGFATSQLVWKAMMVKYATSTGVMRRCETAHTRIMDFSVKKETVEQSVQQLVFSNTFKQHKVGFPQ